MRLAVERLDGLVLRPGEWFSFWSAIPEPRERNGFLPGPSFSEHRVSLSVGGGLCQISGLLYNLALLSGMEILERHPHSIDAYGEDRYLPLGRDATVAYLSKDLAFRNVLPHAVRLQIDLSDRAVRGQMLSDVDPAWKVTIRSEKHDQDVVTTREIAGPGAATRSFRTVDRYERPQAS
jgi:vancomycin resistance protein VanW